MIKFLKSVLILTKMSRTLNKILDNCKVDGVFFSHVSMINPKGTFQLNRQSIETFWKEYCDIIKCNKNPNVGIAEKPQHYLPILVDVDIKIKETDIEFGEKLYTENHIHSVIEIYQSVLRKIIDNVQDENLICFVLEKPLYQVDNVIKNGFHLHFPYTFLSKTDQESHLLPRVKKLVEENKIFEDIGLKDVDKIIDNSYCRNCWLLYGSKKDESMKAYRLTKIINGEGEEITLEEAAQEYSIYDVEENKIDIKNEEEYYLPRILSILPFGRKTCELKANIQSPIKEFMKRSNKDLKSKAVKYKSESVTEELKTARELLLMVNDSRAENYNDWMDIGWTLYNISDADEEGLNLWIDFSSRCGEKFDENNCVHLWSKMVKKDKTLGSLKFIAEQDNPEEFRVWKTQRKKQIVDKNLSSYSHNDIARFLYEECGTKYICASITYNTWYEFQNHHWKEIDDGITLREKISSEGPGSQIEELRGRHKSNSERVVRTDDDYEIIKCNGEIKNIVKILSNLRSAPFKNNVLRECKEVFYDGDFLKQLDRNPFLVGFKNGVYDLKTHTFREGRPDDYISLQMPINYIEFHHKDKKVADVYDFLEKIFPDKSLRDYFLDNSSDVFIGGNQAKKVWFWSGEGDNGKSVTQSIFEKMLGRYAVKLPTSLIVGKRTASSAACPELVRAGNGVRWAVLQEPDKKDVINIGILKELSGNDSFYARGLFKEGGEMEPMFKLVVICNDPPSIPHSDKATWNRIRVIPFESTFCDDPPATYEEQLKEKKFPKDPFFAEKIPDMVQAFCWILLNHRKDNKRRLEPEKVKLATQMYKIKNDVYRQFIDECVVEDEKGSISLQELYVFFKEWFRESMPHHTTPTKNEVKEYFIKLWNEPIKTKWQGYKLKSFNEDEVVELDDEDLIKYDDNSPLKVM